MKIMRFVQCRTVENSSICARYELVRQMRAVVESESRPAIGSVKRNFRPVGRAFKGVQPIVMTCGAVDDVPRGLGIVEASGIDRIVSNWFVSLIKVHVSLHVEIDVVLQEQWFKCLLTGKTNITRIVLGGDVPRAMKADDDPWGFIAIDTGKILFQPLDLLIGVSEGTIVCSCICAPGFIRRLQSHWKVSF